MLYNLEVKALTNKNFLVETLKMFNFQFKNGLCVKDYIIAYLKSCKHDFKKN